MNMKTPYELLCLILFSVFFIAITGKLPANNNVINGSNQTEGYLLDGTEKSLGQKIDAYLTSVEAMGFSGAIIVEHEGELVLRKGYGLSDRTNRKPYTPESIQKMGSITKQITAAAILLLEQEGRLSTDNLISEYFDSVPDDKTSITIHHLLTHQAGFPGSIGRDNEAISSPEYIIRAFESPLQFEPGSGYDYSNTGYSLLGIIIEEVSGMDYEEFIRENLFLPAGLNKTGYVLPHWNRNELATGFHDGDEWGRVVDKNWLDEGPGWHLRANGGLHTHVDDMHRWLDVLRGNGPLNSTQTEKWTKGYVDEGFGDSRYAYGWAVHDTEMGIMIAHNGGNGIFSADFVWIPELQFFFYIHGNTSVVAAAQIRESLLRSAFDPEFVMPPVVKVDPDADPSDSKQNEGSYYIDNGNISVKQDDIRLLASVSGQAAIDVLFGHGENQVNRFSELNTISMNALDGIKEGRLDVFEGMVPEDTDAEARAQGLINFLERFGPIKELTLIGTVENAPGGRLAHLGDATTLIRVVFENYSRILSVVWRFDNRYAGTAMGPLSDIPSFVLIPESGSNYSGIEREEPFRMSEFQFRDNCLVMNGQRFCKE
jgi:CubicO group peptidase (beta-lactamase class C family)